MESPFETLGIDPDADAAEIERAYRRRVMETHPDQGGSVDEFRAVRVAYEEIVSRQISEWDHDAGTGASEDSPDPARQFRVEYLDYDALADHGWDLEDDDLFEKASSAGLESPAHGRFVVQPDETLLEAAENRGFAWPYACRGGACANCAVAVTEGDLSMPVNHVLPQEMVDRGIRLSCVGAPTTEETTVVYNVKHLPTLDELRLPPRPFESARSEG